MKRLTIATQFDYAACPCTHGVHVDGHERASNALTLASSGHGAHTQAVWVCSWGLYTKVTSGALFLGLTKKY